MKLDRGQNVQVNKKHTFCTINIQLTKVLQMLSIHDVENVVLLFSTNWSEIFQ